MNTHGLPDMAKEVQAISADHLPACIISGGSPTVPTPPSLVLAAFATEGYVRDTDDLVYVNQESHSITLTGADGTFWLALSVDNWTSYAQWTTEAGTHYRWRPNATQPADVAGLLTFASVTVAGGAVTAVTPLASVTRAAAGRALLGLGTMATQNANAVAITGGAATGLATLTTIGQVGFGGPIVSDERLYLLHVRNQPSNAIGIHAYGDDITGNALQFVNTSGATVGAIYYSNTATAYNTTSDVRCKERITPLTGALTVMKALNPIAHIWKADGSPGVGFRADEVQQVLPEGGVVTGEPGALNEDGTMAPQMMDYSKLVPYLTAACKELAAQVETLTARLQALETGARPGAAAGSPG